MINRYNGDCLELIKDLQDKSIQLVMTSPPYFNSEKKYQRGSGFHNTVPVGEPLFDILELFELLKPKVKDTGFVAMNIGYSYSEGKVNRVGELIRQIERRTHWHNIDKIYWHKTNPIPLRGRLTNSVETIEIFAKVPKLEYPKNINYEHNFIETAVSSSKTSAQKPYPIELPLKCIDIFSNEGDCVLDPFEGSSTTGFAAKELKRDYIGFELSTKVFNEVSELYDN
tara:strand:- start:35 stop:712 length:678 start_codon:yes stop_codon:yes gene_type:complete